MVQPQSPRARRGHRHRFRQASPDGGAVDLLSKGVGLQSVLGGDILATLVHSRDDHSSDIRSIFGEGH
jgi:hypothetical protein